jgi:glycosyltransferase involved in cell wall biosynthesis
MKEVCREVPNSMLICVGGVPDWLKGADYWTILKRQVEASGLAGKVQLLDRVPNRELPAYYSLAGVFVLPSYYEAFAKVVIEAMACSKPVVASDLGGNRDAIEDEQTGILTKYGDSGELSNAIIRVLQDKGLAMGMGEKGRKRVLENFTWKSVANRVSSAYERVMFASEPVSHPSVPS